MTKKSKPMLLVPIEPLSERYTEQWYEQFPIEFTKQGFDVQVIDGIPLQENTIKVGAFLDINSTIHYKCSQLMQLAALFDAGKVADGTVIFFSDIEFWGLESVRLMAQMNKVNVKLVGFLHAGSYTRGDAFEIAAPYQQHTELGWVKALDKIFVGSHYHKGAFLSRRAKSLPYNDYSNLQKKIVVTGNPMFKKYYKNYKVAKQEQVLLTNRFDSEKDPRSTLDLFAKAKAKHPEWRFLVTTGRKEFRSNDPSLVEYARLLEAQGVLEIKSGISKNEYHKYLASSMVMVSHSPEENFGYALMEAALYRCQPLLLLGESSHEELMDYDKRFLFNRGDDLSKLEALMANPDYDTVEGLADLYLTEPMVLMAKEIHAT
jgi:glycosyltransferase involved in cell wall biosynthesis